MKKLALTLTLMMMLSALAGCSEGGKYIGTDNAGSIALENAGVAEADVVGMDVSLNKEALSGAVYEVDFDANGYEYEYEIDAETGDILRRKMEVDDSSRLPASTSEDRTPHNGSTEPPTSEPESSVTGTSAVQSSSSSSSSKAPAPQSSSSVQTTPTQSAAAPKNEYIGGEKARDIALKHAGYSADQVYDLEYELDRERGVVVYDVSFDADDYDYDYEIDAVTGEILRSDKEWDNDYKPDPSLNTAEYIGSEKAKTIALDHAGLSSANVRELEVELDHRLNSVVYEVSFDSSGYEYDYEIDAYSGEILNSKKERD